MSLLDRILRRRSHYRAVFRPGASTEQVLADLRRFCRHGQPTIAMDRQGCTDLYATGMVAGRQEVFARIVAHLHLDDSQLLKLKEVSENDD